MKQLLVIDDEVSIRALLKKILEREGFKVIVASDGIEGMKLVKKESIDLVITDIIMPEKDGTEIIIELKKNFPDIPVLAMSGGGKNSSEGYLDVAKILGAKAIFNKPLDKDDLLIAINKALK